MSRSIFTLCSTLYSDTGNVFIVGPTRAFRNEGQYKLVLFCHGSGGTATSTMTDAQKQTVLDLGVDTVCICGNWGGETWGDDNAIAACAAGVAYARANLACVGPVGMVGASMGNIVAMNYARAHPSDVGAIASVIPAINIQQIYTNFPAYVPFIDGAYPPGWSDVTFRAHNPIHMAEDDLLDSDLPVKIWSLSTDTLALPSTQYAFVAARPQTEITDFSAPGLVHGAAAVDYIRPDVVSWMKGKLL